MLSYEIFPLFSSAGVGRTGTFLALDIMLERIPQTHDVNVYECVQIMRTKRIFMVQTAVCYFWQHVLHNFLFASEPVQLIMV